eukprot:scaffold18.g1953.t1
MVRTLGPATHAYSFWEGTSPGSKAAFGRLFAASRTLRAMAVVQRAGRGAASHEVMAELGFGRLMLVGTIAVSMSHTFAAYAFARVVEVPVQPRLTPNLPPGRVSVDTAPRVTPRPALAHPPQQRMPRASNRPEEAAPKKKKKKRKKNREQRGEDCTERQQREPGGKAGCSKKRRSAEEEGSGAAVAATEALPLPAADGGGQRQLGRELPAERKKRRQRAGAGGSGAATAAAEAAPPLVAHHDGQRQERTLQASHKKRPARRGREQWLCGICSRGSAGSRARGVARRAHGTYPKDPAYQCVVCRGIETDDTSANTAAWLGDHADAADATHGGPAPQARPPVGMAARSHAARLACEAAEVAACSQDEDEGEEEEASEERRPAWRLVGAVARSHGARLAREAAAAEEGVGSESSEGEEDRPARRLGGAAARSHAARLACEAAEAAAEDNEEQPRPARRLGGAAARSHAARLAREAAEAEAAVEAAAWQTGPPWRPGGGAGRYQPAEAAAEESSEEEKEEEEEEDAEAEEDEEQPRGRRLGGAAAASHAARLAREAAEVGAGAQRKAQQRGGRRPLGRSSSPCKEPGRIGYVAPTAKRARVDGGARQPGSQQQRSQLW